MPYNLLNITNTTNPVTIIRGVNTEIGHGMFGLMVLISVFIIAWTTLSYYSTEGSLLLAMFITTILAIFLWLLGILAYFVVIFCILLLVLAVIVSFFMR